MWRLSMLLTIAWLVPSGVLGADPPGPADWPQYNQDNRGWRFNAAEKHLRPDNVASLVIKWRFPPPGAAESDSIGAVHATPVVVNGFTYAGSAKPGVLFKLSPQGNVVWRFEVPKSKFEYTFVGPDGKSQQFGEAGLFGWSITNSPLVTADSVYLATGDGQIFCLDRFSGAVKWSVETRGDAFPGQHVLNTMWASPILADGKLIVAGGAGEQLFLLRDPNYECCTGRGFVAAFHPHSGALIWKYDLGPAVQRFEMPRIVDYGEAGKVTYTHGPSTSTIWSTPSYDPDSQLIFFGTDTHNSPRQPTPDDRREYNEFSCAVVALDVRTGQLRWVRQLVENDMWNGKNPGWDERTAEYKDLSIGDTPKVYEIEHQGRSCPVIGVGCKNGGYYVLDRTTGEMLYHTPLYLGPPDPNRVADAPSGVLALPSMLGGLQTGCAFDGQRAFTNGIDWPGVVKGSASGRWFLYPPSAGRVTAIRPNALAEFWRHERPQLQVQRLDHPTQSMTAGDPVGAGIAVANGIAFFTTTISNKLVAVDCSNGQLLFERELEPLWTGPAVSRGRVFVGTGSVLWQPEVPEPAATYVFNFPIHPNGAVYCFGLPGADEFDLLPEMEVATTQ